MVWGSYIQHYAKKNSFSGVTLIKLLKFEILNHLVVFTLCALLKNVAVIFLTSIFSQGYMLVASYSWLVGLKAVIFFCEKFTSLMKRLIKVYESFRASYNYILKSKGKCSSKLLFFINIWMNFATNLRPKYRKNEVLKAFLSLTKSN